MCCCNRITNGLSQGVYAAIDVLALSGMQPTSRFDKVSQYSNLMASVAGYIGAHLLQPNGDLGLAYDTTMQKQIFDPLRMANTTFDMNRALSGNLANPYSTDLDGHTVTVRMDENYAWCHPPCGRSVDLGAQYDALRNAGTVTWQAARWNAVRVGRNLLARRKPQIFTGEDQSYGMGLEVDTLLGAPIVHHGGSLFGYKSGWINPPGLWPRRRYAAEFRHRGMLLDPFMRKLVEVVFNGTPEAIGDVNAATANSIPQPQRNAHGSSFPLKPPNRQIGGSLRECRAAQHRCKRSEADTISTLDAMESRMASRKNDDGTVSFMLADPPLAGFEFMEGERAGKRALIVRDGSTSMSSSKQEVRSPAAIHDRHEGFGHSVEALLQSHICRRLRRKWAT